MDLYIAQENIKRFTELLENDLDPTLRKMVIRLLSIEKSKLGALLVAGEILTQRSKTRSK